MLVCYIASRCFLLAQAQETFAICPGDSIFLPVLQSFSDPPQDLVGLDGGIPITPCSNEAIPTNENALVTTYAWLQDLVDINNYSGTTIEVYEVVGNIYLLIKTNDEQNLYFKDGTFFCKTQPNYDCLTTYQLNGPIDTWACSGKEIVPRPIPIAARKQYTIKQSF